MVGGIIGMVASVVVMVLLGFGVSGVLIVPTFASLFSLCCGLASPAATVEPAAAGSGAVRASEAALPTRGETSRGAAMADAAEWPGRPSRFAALGV